MFPHASTTIQSERVYTIFCYLIRFLPMLEKKSNSSNGKMMILIMAFAFETRDTILTQEQADHINARHVSKETHPRTSKFKLSFNLSSTLVYLATKTWDNENAEMELIELERTQRDFLLSRLQSISLKNRQEINGKL